MWWVQSRLKKKKIALMDYHPYKPGVLNGYPLLRKAGEELNSMSVNFTDLTMIFYQNTDVLYNDDCCHLNAEGYNVIADHICEVIHNNMIRW